MGRRIVPITARSVDQLPWPCRDCAFWETGPARHRDRVASTTGGAAAKAGWVERTTAEWGTCGQLAYVDEVPAGYVTYAPPAFVPRASAFPTSPVSADAVQLEITTSTIGKVDRPRCSPRKAPSRRAACRIACRTAL